MEIGDQFISHPYIAHHPSVEWQMVAKVLVALFRHLQGRVIVVLGREHRHLNKLSSKALSKLLNRGLGRPLSMPFSRLL